GEVADAALGHDGDVHGGHDFFDQLGIRHARNAAFGADDGGHTFEGHDGDGTGLFGDLGLGDAHHVHDHAALQHFGEAGLKTETVGVTVAGVAISVGHE